MMRGISGCCRDCTERYLGCHDHCKKYLSAREEWREYSDKLRQARKINEYDLHKMEVIRRKNGKRSSN